MAERFIAFENNEPVEIIGRWSGKKPPGITGKQIRRHLENVQHEKDKEEYNKQVIKQGLKR